MKGNFICQNCYNRQVQSAPPAPAHPATMRGKREKKPKSCPNCNMTNTTLWRKFKSADEVEKEIGKNSKIKDRAKVDRTRPDLEGVLGCNACTLYWKLHGVSFFSCVKFEFFARFRILAKFRFSLKMSIFVRDLDFWPEF